MKVTVTKIADEMIACCEATTGGKDASKVDRYKMYKAEHSPIRSVIFGIELIDIPSYVSVHMVRHKHGVEHFVQSKRQDRGGDGTEDRQTLINHTMIANAQAIINISRKRLCRQADEQTIRIWDAVCQEIAKIDHALFRCCVPDCYYKFGNCTELKPCGFFKSFRDRASLDIAGKDDVIKFLEGGQK